MDAFFLAKYLFISEKNTNNKIPLKSSFLAANYCTSLRAWKNAWKILLSGDLR